MLQHSFQLRTFIDIPVEGVYEHLTDPRNLLGFQPLLIELSPIR